MQLGGAVCNKPALCLAGYYNSGSVCSRVPAGYYIPFGTAVYYACPVGWYSPAGSTSCSLANDAYYNPLPAMMSSWSCPQASQSGAFVCNTGTGSSSCLPGQYFTGLACQDVPAGYFNPSASIGTFYPCKQGTYSSTGASACSPCPIGMYANVVGSTACIICPQSVMPGAAICPTSGAVATGN